MLLVGDCVAVIVLVGVIVGVAPDADGDRVELRVAGMDGVAEGDRVLDVDGGGGETEAVGVYDGVGVGITSA